MWCVGVGYLVGPYLATITSGVTHLVSNGEGGSNDLQGSRKFSELKRGGGAI